MTLHFLKLGSKLVTDPSIIFGPGLVESILVKAKSWEVERQKVFLYNEVTQFDAFVN